MNLSIICPLYNEEESLKELSQWINKVCSDNNFLYELIFVDDGSNESVYVHKATGIKVMETVANAKRETQLQESLVTRDERRAAQEALEREGAAT